MELIMAFVDLLPPEAVSAADGAVVKKSNELIMSNMDDMSLKEAQLLALAISKIPREAKQNPKENITIAIPRKEFDLIFQLNGHSLKKLEILCAKLQTRVAVVRSRSTSMSNCLDLGIPNGRREEEWKRMVIVPTCEYKAKTFYLTLNAHLNEHFFALIDRATSYDLINLIGLSSNHHIRCYEYLVLKLSEGHEHTTSIDEFRTLMAAKDKYPRFPNLKNRILDPAIEAINRFTDITVSYDVIQNNRQPSGIKFKISKKTDSVAVANGVASEMDEKTRLRVRMVEHLRSLGFSTGGADKAVSEFKGTEDEFYDAVKAGQEYAQSLKDKNTSDVNVAGIIYKSIQNGWVSKSSKVSKLQPSLNLLPSGKAETKVIEPPVDIEPMIAALEASEEMERDFFKFLLRMKDDVLIDLIGKHGIREMSADGLLKERLALFSKAKMSRIKAC
ncbi:MAG: replication initiation protein [Halothiobacillus sp.]|jgi:hypothetical protein|nr:replication initiation protein [Halothiobacillus sp.]